jgi:hypothetical protein
MPESDRGLAVAQLVINFTMAAISVGIAVIFTLHLQTLIKHTSSLFFLFGHAQQLVWRALAGTLCGISFLHRG